MAQNFERDPTMPQHRADDKPEVPEKIPFETSAGTIQLDEMKATYGQTAKLQAEPASRMERKAKAEDEIGMESLGFKAMEQSGDDAESRKALMEGLLPAQNSTLPPPMPSIRSSTPRDSSQNDMEGSYFNTTEDIPSLRRKHSGNPSHESRLYQRLEELQRKLNQATARAEIAEEKVEMAESKISTMKSEINSSFTEVEKDTQALVDELKMLRVENATLKEQLNDAQSHIFSLQPYRKELTPEEVGRDYDDLIEGVTDWVAKFMAPLLDDHATGVDLVMTTARKRPTDHSKFKRDMHNHADLVHGSAYPEMDEDIVISTIMRFLHEKIFSRILYGAIPNYVEVLSFIETGLQTNVDPKRDLFAIRTWTAEAYNALISAPQFQSVRSKSCREMTHELGSLLRVFCKKDKLEWFLLNLQDNCIKPAMALYEKLQVSTHHFYLDINPYIIWGHGGDLETSPDFLDSLEKLDCRNILQNRKAFQMSKFDPLPTKKELYHKLQNICTVTPALYMRQIGRKDAIKEPVLVRKQQVLVAWGSPEQREKFLKDGDKTLTFHLYCNKPARETSEGWGFARWG